MTELSFTTLKQLIVERPDLVSDIRANKDQPTPTVTVQNDEKGRMLKWTEETRDIDGNITGKRVDTYSYYATGEVNEIVQEKYDGKVLAAKKKIKHYTDGRQPVATALSTVAVIDAK